MTQRPILVLDAGTTSTRAMLYAPDGTRIATAQAALTQYYPHPGWVEHDAEEIWRRSLACARRMVKRAGGADRIAAIGITNQRETVIAWDRHSAKPLHRAIVWQDRRTADQCDALREAGHEPMLARRTGLVVDPYFSATKMRWLLDHAPAVRDAGDRLCLGTVESWLVWKLTGGLHVTDASNASRTQLMALDEDGWNADLCALFGIPRAALPEIVDNAGAFGETRPDLLGAPVGICGLAGDQQAATIGQACLRPGDAKATLGTGAFILANMGEAMPASSHRLLGTLLYRIGSRRAYALEGSIFVAGSLMQWLRDRLGLIENVQDSAALARSVPDNGGIFMLPALVGLGAPHWKPQARGAIVGLTQGTTRAHIVRAALESLSHQIHDLADAFAADGAPWRVLRVDGGMSANDWIVQDMADMLSLPVDRPLDVETTALGAAMLAGVGAGLFGSLEEASVMASQAMRFTPAMGVTKRAARLRGWRAVLAAHA
ncbi:glycerol kinase [Sphingobium wenxiniae]|uniref:Glycerol kinase n=2 Tax=Sphingobium TaxID=165695 RepID=T0GP07_9SPHN|nr:MULTISPECIES: glycerol kinase GlpK [Sphingobium]EQB01738.1 glycerol kinase [Sphingobium baderi LL03]KMS62364.1 glycerol kinase [Sphingobium baderi LL03]MBB6191677.1 glycerol kinase [Sphingobium wenxiniae]TWH92724.1 glycerol kinase [Sphingobium wenxiniae]